MGSRTEYGGEVGLDEAEVMRFHEQGFLGPFTAMTRDEMAEIRAYAERHILDSDGGPWPDRPLHDRHLDHEAVYRMYTNPEIVGRMASIYGDDLLLWASHFWNKEPGDPEVHWHQDGAGWFVEPPLTVSAWIAIDEATTANSCVKLIPGSHRRWLPHVDAPDGAVFDTMADPEAFDPNDAVPMELEPGQFFLFTERTLHQSDPNTSEMRRLGTSMRVTVPFVNVLEEELYEGYRAAVISGNDWHEINTTERSFE